MEQPIRFIRFPGSNPPYYTDSKTIYSKSSYKNWASHGWSGCNDISISGTETRHISLHLLQPWQAWFVCGDSDLGQCTNVEKKCSHHCYSPVVHVDPSRQELWLATHVCVWVLGGGGGGGYTAPPHGWRCRRPPEWVRYTRTDWQLHERGRGAGSL